MSGCHDDVGHVGWDRTLSLLRERFFWPGMAKMVTDYVAQCGRCLRRKGSTKERAPLVPIVTTQPPLEMVCIDFLSLEPSKGGVENILVVTDHFFRYAEAYLTKNQTAQTTAKILYENFVVHYGFPACLHGDQGRSFESSIIRHMCELAGVKGLTQPPTILLEMDKLSASIALFLE